MVQVFSRLKNAQADGIEKILMVGTKLYLAQNFLALKNHHIRVSSTNIEPNYHVLPLLRIKRIFRWISIPLATLCLLNFGIPHKYPYSCTEN